MERPVAESRNQSSRGKLVAEVVSTSDSHTRRFGGALASQLRPGDLVLLEGPLGSGKTTMVRGMAEALGCIGVASPTFVLIREYEGRTRLRHVDLFRIEDTEALFDLGVEELFDPSAITVVEWPEPLLSLARDGYLGVRLSYGERPEERRLVVYAEGSKFDERMQALRRAVLDEQRIERPETMRSS